MYTVTCNDDTVQNVKHVPDEELLGRRFLWIQPRPDFSDTWRGLSWGRVMNKWCFINIFSYLVQL